MHLYQYGKAFVKLVKIRKDQFTESQKGRINTDQILLKLYFNSTSMVRLFSLYHKNLEYKICIFVLSNYIHVRKAKSDVYVEMILR